LARRAVTSAVNAPPSPRVSATEARSQRAGGALARSPPVAGVQSSPAGHTVTAATWSPAPSVWVRSRRPRVTAAPESMRTAATLRAPSGALATSNPPAGAEATGERVHHPTAAAGEPA